jgi:hypothetical protein
MPWHFHFGKREYRAIFLSLFVFGVLAGTNAAAGTVAFTPPGAVTPAGEPNDPVNLGNVFTANANFSVAALGFYNQPDLTGPETVALYNSSGSLLASATVLLSDPMVDGYLFAAITPVALTAGDQYTVDAFVGNNDWSYGSTAPIQASDITYNYHDYVYTSSLEFPTDTASAAGGPAGTYYGPNFEIESVSRVPEPGSLGLLVAAVLLTYCLHYRRLSARG